MRERWGTFSVRDHITKAPFVADVLLFDRLVIPVPDRADKAEMARWEKDWQPELLLRCLEVLGTKTEETDGLALPVVWDASKRERFASRMSTAAALAARSRNPNQTYYVDPFAMTRELGKNEFKPALPHGVSKAWAVAAYSSTDAFRADFPQRTPSQTRFAAVIRHRFLAPEGADPRQEMLRRAVDLSMTDAFRRKRQRFYEWQENIIEEDISEEKAIEELESRLAEYNKATENAFRTTLGKFVFTVLPVALTMTGGVMGADTGSMLPLVLGGASGLVTVTRFAAYDRKPVIASGDLDAAAMIHDARSAVSLS